MELTAALSLVAQGLLIVALPIVIWAAIQHIRAMSQQIQLKMSDDQRAAVDNAIKTGVKVAEQTGLLKNLIGPEKKKEAIAVAEKFLADKGIKLDLDKLSDLIEAEVQTQFAKPTPPADSPEARQQLIDSALHAAVMAAEQSGLTGLIRDIGPEKKAYAAGMALKYLDQYGIKLDPQLLSGLIESKLLESVNAGRSAGAPATVPQVVMPAPVALPPAYAPSPAQPLPAYVPPPAQQLPAYIPPAAQALPVYVPPAVPSVSVEMQVMPPQSAPPVPVTPPRPPDADGPAG